MNIRAIPKYATALKTTNKSLQVLLMAVCLLFLAGFIYISLSSMGYHYELEWVEGNSLHQVQRMVDGGMLYDKPSLHYIPNVYTPLYFFVSSAVSVLFGVSFFTLRLVSFVSTLLCLMLIFMWVRRETDSSFAAIFAGGLFAATFGLCGFWFDLARIDMLFLVFLLAAVFRLRYARLLRDYILASILLFLSFFTKQGALFICLPLMIYLFFRDWKKALVFNLTFLGLIGVSTWLLDALYNGWYSFYVFIQPNSYVRELAWNKLGGYLTGELLLPMCMAWLLAITAFVIKGSKPGSAFWFYFFLTAGMVGVLIPVRLTEGSYVNNFIPLYGLLSILAGIGLGMIPEALNSKGHVKQGIIGLVILLMCIGQFGLLFYQPADAIPTEADKLAGDRLVSEIGNLQGRVFIPYHGYLAAYAGKESYAHAVCINAVMTGREGAIKSGLEREMQEAIIGKYFEYIILDNMNTPAGYMYLGSLLPKDDTFWTITGDRNRPNYLYKRSR